LLSLALYSSHLPGKFLLPNILKFSIQCKAKRTENFYKFGEGSTLNNRRSHTGDELQSFDVFGKHLTTSDPFQNYDAKDTCNKPVF
jgi:hypothetical protein